MLYNGVNSNALNMMQNSYIIMTEKTDVKKHNIRKSILRLLSALVDYIIIMLPVQLILMGVVGTGEGNADFLFRMLFAVYGVIMISITKYGQTVGKMLSKTAVRDSTGIKSVLMYTGMRELTKLLYFVPYIGWGLGAVSILLMFVKGRALHDYIADTGVFFIWEIPENPEDKEREEVSGR